MKKILIVLVSLAVLVISLFLFLNYILLDIEVSLKYEEWDKDLYTKKKNTILSYITYCKYFIKIIGAVIGVIIIYKLIKKDKSNR